MIRAALVGAGLAAWLGVGLGLRAHFGGRAYVAKVMGPDAPAEALFGALAKQPELTVMGMNPWALLATASVLAATALLLVIAPVESLLRRRGTSAAVRGLCLGGLSVGLTGAVLKSIHPILSMRSVPEGPRTVLNYACEAAGYGWVNGLAHGGAVLAALGLVWLGVRDQDQDQDQDHGGDGEGGRDKDLDLDLDPGHGQGQVQGQEQEQEQEREREQGSGRSGAGDRG